MARRQPDDDMVEAHRQRVEHLLLPLLARDEVVEVAASPEGRALLGAPPELRASLTIAALAGPRSGWSAAHLAEVAPSDQWPAELVRALARRTIAWDPESAALALRLVAGTDFDHERIHLVLKAADQIAEAHPAHPGVMDGLDRVHARVQATPPHRHRVPEVRARVVASISRHSPPELLDLSPIADTDTWGPPARAILRAADERDVDVRSILGCLTAAPSSTAPTARWVASLGPAIGSSDAGHVVRDLVRLLVELDLDERRAFVAPGNDSVARAAVWALGHGGAELHDIDLLRRVALRCSRTNGRPNVTEALCGKAAGAAITGLGRLRQEAGAIAAAAERALDELWSTVDRGDVLARIGRALGRSDEEVAQRVTERRRSRARAARIDRQPGEDAARLAEVVDEDVAARLRQRGFDDRSRRTFRRHHPGRTDVVTVSLAAAEVRLRFGIGFHAGAERPRWRLDDLDVAADLWLISTPPDETGEVTWLDHRATRHQDRADRRRRRGPTDPLETLARLAERFDSVAIPALDRWADPALLACDLEDLEVPFRHGELLLGLDFPTGPERASTVRRLREHASDR